MPGCAYSVVDIVPRPYHPHAKKALQKVRKRLQSDYDGINGFVEKILAQFSAIKISHKNGQMRVPTTHLEPSEETTTKVLLSCTVALPDPLSTPVGASCKRSPEGSDQGIAPLRAGRLGRLAARGEEEEARGPEPHAVRRRHR